MGMFDTIWGKIICTNCNKEFTFEEQTKEYDCLLENFYLGDYIDKGNANYFYKFKAWCPHCDHIEEWAIAVKRGQIVGFYLAKDATVELLDSLSNIEDGYYRNLEYKEKCKKKLGFSKSYLKVKNYEIGETINVLENDWVIDEIYKEILDESLEDSNLFKYLMRNNVILKVHDKETERIIVIKERAPAGVFLPTLEQKEHWEKEEYYTNFIKTRGTKVIRIK